MRRSADLLWGRGRPGRRGPKAQLSLERVVEAAAALADAEGLAAVSMQRVAAELGYTTMSLYNHVPSKELLLEAMADAVVGQPPADTGEDWRASVLAWAADIWRVFAAHPWLLRLQFDHPPLGPNQLAWLERLLRAMTAGGLTGLEAMSAAMYTVSAVRGMSQVQQDLHRSVPDATDRRRAEAEYQRVLTSVIDLSRYPTLARVFADPEPEPDAAPDSLPPEIEFGLQRLLDGIEAHVRRRRAAH
ncbi:TetR/AcrR family transcriptional regulator C-terminal domain-containing protein [Nannocystis punicea]|uniref:TetR/AcrR family transcriptional regulator C-terminal domain-containing protein n=1 Tax=Nannocystis punicea TaxID=2995304 RepID=A0ABY7H682_9BACT|nr:TetR/AcrR family transcriptional regulator C-terminal domain-containing protein [Nannocystis poenicansa]WAS94781.1 TetR/AcrR family transcriptional regulator C-terminal domain-containing protein [Nannocystis poenicansa]